MNLVCFPHYTCGGLLCDILNNTQSPLGYNGGVASPHHNLGKMGDSDSVLVDYDVAQFMKKISRFPNQWYLGTHNWPGHLPLDKFNQVINITTSTHRSRLYRWLRAYHFYYSNSEPWLSVQGQDRIDKERETAKNYLIPFDPVSHPCVVNLEFSDIVELKPSFTNLVANYNSIEHIQGWCHHNNFLFDCPAWVTSASDRLHEAEVEVKLNTFYVYQ
jgi:hypothetical protein